jgi:hypothetical protein
VTLSPNRVHVHLRVDQLGRTPPVTLDHVMPPSPVMTPMTDAVDEVVDVVPTRLVVMSAGMVGVVVF